MPILSIRAVVRKGWRRLMAKKHSPTRKSIKPPSSPAASAALSGVAPGPAGSSRPAGTAPAGAASAGFEHMLGGAGSHKTTQLCDRAIDYLISSGEHASRLVLTTYSRDAAAQLLDRLRTQTLQHKTLSWEQKRDIVAALEHATVSTSHALGRAALEQHWLERASVPSPAVVTRVTYDKLAHSAVRKVLRKSLPAGKRKKLRSLIRRLGRGQAEKRGEFSTSGDVMQDIHKLMAMVPDSGMSRPDFVKSCSAAIDTLRRALTAERRRRGFSGSQAALLAACRVASTSLSPVAAIRGGVTLTAFDAINEYIATQAWHCANKLTKVAGHKTSDRKTGAPATAHLVAPVATAAADYHLLPEFADDMRRYVRSIADVAYAAYDELRSTLARAGRIDFAEMEQSFNKLLDDAAIRGPFANGYGFIGIDEAQDMTSANAAAFEKLTAAVGRGAWIADPNQSIYGFRNADHKAVQDAANRLVTTLKGATSLQGENHRSPTGIIRFVNDLFHILTLGAGSAPPLPSSHAQNASAKKAGDNGRIERWVLQGAKQPDWCAEIAEGVHRLRSRSPDPVPDEEICILVRTNTAKTAMAAALEERGIPVAMRNAEVGNSREGLILLAAIRLMVNPNDSLAEATLRFLLDDRSKGVGNPDFDQWLQARLAASGGHATPAYLVALEDLNKQAVVATLSPVSAVLLAIEVTGLVGRITAWGNGIERQSHIDALLTLAQSYEQSAKTAGQLATVAGFIAWSAAAQFSSGSGEPESDAPPKDMPGVRLMTCHAAKGLGHKITILSCFEMPVGVSRAYGISRVAGKPHVIPDPIKDCTNTDLERIICNLPAATTRHLEAIAAETQLLYVGLTRSERELILAHPKNDSNNTWLTNIFGASNPAAGHKAGIDHFLDTAVPSATAVTHPLPSPPAPLPPTGVKLNAADYAFVDDLNKRVAGAAAGKPTPIQAFESNTPRPLSAVASPVRYSSPSSNHTAIGGWRNSGTCVDTPLPPGAVRDLVTPALVEASKGVANALGNAFHAFMAAIPSLPSLELATQSMWDAVATRCLRGYLDAGTVKELAACGLTSTVFVDRAHSFVAWCRDTLGVEPVDWLVEAPVSGRTASGSTWRGRIDLLIQAKAGDYAGQWTLVDHKAVLVPTGECVARTDDYIGEVSAYAEALSAVQPASLSPKAIFIHYPLAGTITFVTRP